jgi:hypothetical protein
VTSTHRCIGGWTGTSAAGQSGSSDTVDRLNHPRVMSTIVSSQMHALMDPNYDRACRTLKGRILDVRTVEE